MKRAKCGGVFAGPVLSYIDGCSVEVVVFYKMGPFSVTLPAELLWSGSRRSSKV